MVTKMTGTAMVFISSFSILASAYILAEGINDNYLTKQGELVEEMGFYAFLPDMISPIGVVMVFALPLALTLAYFVNDSSRKMDFNLSILHFLVILFSLFIFGCSSLVAGILGHTLNEAREVSMGRYVFNSIYVIVVCLSIGLTFYKLKKRCLDKKTKRLS